MGRPQWLVMRKGPFWERGRTWELASTSPGGMLGRAASCQWRVQDLSVSKLHAALVRKPKRGVYLVDLSSREGTFLNGKPVQDEVMLMNGDQIGLGDRIVLEYSDHPVPVSGNFHKWRRAAMFSVIVVPVLLLAVASMILR